MSSHTFDPQAERYMMDHMNTDHADANLLYVQVYGKCREATAARMVRLDRQGMDLEVTLPDGIQRLRIAFDRVLADAKDAERTLVAMSRHAQAVMEGLGATGAQGVVTEKI